MKSIKLLINTESGNYPIIIGSNLVKNLSKILKKNSINSKKFLLVIDKKIPKNMVYKILKSLKGKKVFKCLFDANEKNKNQKNSDKIISILLKNNFSRNDCLISIGGGITGDVSGFAASLFKRGLQFINIPTTLLSQVDSSVGGKTGINTKYGKNLIGNFYQPKIVISDISFLKSLPIREIICGYGEILKHSLISNKNLFLYLGKNFDNIINLQTPYLEKSIYESCKIKKSVVEKDEKEKGMRKILNFGHTFAHAYEGTLGYSKTLNHGEAVILGIKTALKFSLINKQLKKNIFEKIMKQIHNPKLPQSIKSYFKLKHLNKILNFMEKDKKNNSSKINLVLIKDIGKPIIGKEFERKKIKKFLRNELSD